MPVHGGMAAHAPTHEDGGVDEIDVTGLSGLLADDQHVLDAEVLAVASALVHAARHENGGADEINVAGLNGLLADDQHVLDAEVLLVAAALVHAGRHENGGADEISVLGLSGLLADAQTPLPHALATTGPHNAPLPLTDLAVGARGEIIHRGVADWAALPVGALGDLLTSGGPGADVGWAAPGPPGVHGAAQHTDVTREYWISANEGSLYLGTSVPYSYYAAVTLDDGADQGIYVTFKVPDDFVSFTSLKMVWISNAAAGNMRWKLNVKYAAAGEDKDTHLDNPAEGETATGGLEIINVQEPANALTLVNIALGDYVGLYVLRYGAHANDTLDDDVSVFGFLFTYTASQ